MKRHVPVKGRRGIYFSTRVDGTKVYEVRFRDKGGKQHFKVAGTTLDEALDEQAVIRVKLGKAIRVHYAPMSFGHVAEEWEGYRYPRLAIGTERKYRDIVKNFLNPEFGTKKIRSITTDHIAAFLAGLKTATGKPMSGSYAQGIYVVLYNILEYAANDRRGYIPKNPCRSLEAGERPKPNPSVKRAMTKEEVKALLAASPGWFKPMLLCGLHSGMRPSEILGLRWDYVDLEANELKVHWQLLKNGTYAETKGREKREVPLLPPLRAVLFALPTRFTGQHVFVNPEGGRATYDAMQRAFQKARGQAGLDDKLTMHVCRHTFASALLRNGEDIVWVSQLLGHKDTTTTLRTYAHVMNRDNRNEEAALRLAEALGDLG